MKANYKFILWIGVLVFYALVLFLSFNKHSKSGLYNYHSEIWADKAGYYVYLPAALKFQFNPSNFPDSIDVKTGNGFVLDFENSKVLTKYTYGIALMQFPFFFIADLIADNTGLGEIGFGQAHHAAINIAGSLYLLMGLVFLGLFLSKIYTTQTVFLTLALLFLGSNLYYYAIDATGMSHVYSFALFCLFLYLLQVTDFFKNKKLSFYLMIGIIAGLIIIVRPSNVIFLSAYLFLNLGHDERAQDRFRRVLQPNVALAILCGVILILIPQMIYWKYAFGSYFTYSYTGEGFNWLDPKLLYTWFSPNNGLFPYTPIYLVVLASIVALYKQNKQNAIYLITLFMVISYVFSSWWDWSFGCSFGARNFVEYLAIFSISIATLVQWGLNHNRQTKILVYVGSIILILFNLKIIYTYDTCYYGNGAWDWAEYFRLIAGQTK